MKSNPYSRSAYSSSSRTRRSTSPINSDGDLRAIADRLNDIIERSNQIDQQLTRIEELRHKTPSKNRKSTSSQQHQNDFLSPVAFSQNSEIPPPYSSLYKSSVRGNYNSAIGSKPSPKQSSHSLKNYNLSPSNNQNYSPSSVPSYKPSSAPSSPPISSPRSYATTYSKSDSITLEQIFEAICQLRQEVAEISATQSEMKLEISRLKRGQK